MAILDLPSDCWHSALGIAKGQQPTALVLEGTWWRERATRNRLACLSDVRETAFPDIFIGRHGNFEVAYCCAYGAARAVEPAHIFAQMGTPLLIQIGTCGAVDAALETGTVMVPDRVIGRDGVSQHYAATNGIMLDAANSVLARKILDRNAVPATNGLHLTWPSLFAQSDAMCAEWANEGVRTVDMETAAVAAVAHRFGASAVATLTVWDALSAGKSFLDPLTAAQSAALAKADTLVFDVALELAAQVEQARNSYNKNP